MPQFRIRAVAIAVAVLLAALVVPTVMADDNALPEADAGLDQHVERGAEVLLDAGGSRDPDGRIVGYRWRILAPNGTTFEPTCGTCRAPDFVPTSLGTYNVTVTATDDHGATRNDTLYVTVEKHRPPTVDLTGPAVVEDTGEFRASASAGEYDLDYVVWRVDGDRRELTPVSGRSDATNRTIEFESNGTHTVSATVHDWMGGIARDDVTVDVNATERTGSGEATEPPQISIVDWPTEGVTAGDGGRFVARASDPDGGAVGVSWNRAGSGGRVTTIPFPNAGRYRVTATATDDDGETATDSVIVDVSRNREGRGFPRVNITRWPTEPITVGENATFRATTSQPNGDPVPIVWSGGRASGSTAELRFGSPGEHEVTATARVNASYRNKDVVTVTVEPQEGPSADVAITPQCSSNRRQECGSVTTTTSDPMQFTSTSSPGGATIVARTWAIDGEPVANGDSFATTFAAKTDSNGDPRSLSTYNVTLTVEDEFGHTDAVTREFYVKNVDGFSVDIAMASDLAEVCATRGSDCSWDPSSQTLTVARGTTTLLTASSRTAGSRSPRSDYSWQLPDFATDVGGGSDDRHRVRWAEIGTGTVVLTGDRAGRTAIDTATVEVVEGGNSPPEASIVSTELVCEIESPGVGCEGTNAIDVEYEVSDPDSDRVTVETHLSPEDTSATNTVNIGSGGQARERTQRMVVSEDGRHFVRVTASDGRQSAEADTFQYVSNATGETGGETDGVVIDGKWALKVEIWKKADGTAEVRTVVSCTTEAESICPGEEIYYNWGDGGSDTKNYNSQLGPKSFYSLHEYVTSGYPTLSVSIMRGGEALTTLQRTIDIEDGWLTTRWTFDRQVSGQKKPADWTDTDVKYMDREHLERRRGELIRERWVGTLRGRPTTSPEHDIADTRTITYLKGPKRVSAYKPGFNYVKTKPRVERGRTFPKGTEWFDNRQFGLEYRLVDTRATKVEQGLYSCWLEVMGERDSWIQRGRASYADGCTQLLGPTWDTDYKYQVYHVAWKHEWMFKEEQTEYLLRTYEVYDIYEWERWIRQ